MAAFVGAFALCAAVNAPALAASPSAAEPVYGPMLEGFTYPHPVQRFEFASQRQTLRMAYMDIAPAQGKGNGQTAVLLHGKNFCGATWETTIQALHGAGYRVVAPDQIGFCKSSKPQAYQFSFDQLALNTNDLLKSLHIDKAILVGHSTGGMLAIRYALNYPDHVAKLVLVDPIGLEDWRAKGVPAVSVDQWYKRELGTTADRIRNYERNTYFAGTWNEKYEPWVQMLAGMYRGAGKQAVAWNSALLYDMILTQPVYYDLPRLKVPTTLIIGDKDNTAIGKEYAPEALRSSLGNYPQLGKAAAAAIPNARLIEFPDAGHSPQMQYPEQFNSTLLKDLAS
ncbi:alpha/beta hydrolase [Achromobacter sp. HZ28]|nr:MULTISPECIES: alpha/beta hydrolase [unclassified Achromobacter]OWT77595.1 alpha/beta hydrolase [Achromobacter sp. HZ28]OWT78644.1 alpha/beta hydrolase [Achromobacter sp. HZ34]